MLSREQFDHVMAQATNAAYSRAVDGAKQEECVKAAESVAVAALAAFDKLKDKRPGSIVERAERALNAGEKS
jgi:hypothetical protein